MPPQWGPNAARSQPGEFPQIKMGRRPSCFDGPPYGYANSYDIPERGLRLLNANSKLHVTDPDAVPGKPLVDQKVIDPHLPLWPERAAPGPSGPIAAALTLRSSPRPSPQVGMRQQLWLAQRGVSVRAHLDYHHVPLPEARTDGGADGDLSVVTPARTRSIPPPRLKPSQNFFVQLAGTKQVLIAPPSAHDAFRLYPRHHTSQRQSQARGRRRPARAPTPDRSSLAPRTRQTPHTSMCVVPMRPRGSPSLLRALTMVQRRLCWAGRTGWQERHCPISASNAPPRM